jgi:FMN-dependent NADH-azoreductase
LHERTKIPDSKKNPHSGGHIVPSIVVYSHAGAYGHDSGMNEYGLQIPYLETVLGFIGFGDFQKIVTEESRGQV